MLAAAGLRSTRVARSAEGGVAIIFNPAAEHRAVIESLNNSEAFILLYDKAGNSKTLALPDSAERCQSMPLAELAQQLNGSEARTNAETLRPDAASAEGV